MRGNAEAEVLPGAGPQSPVRGVRGKTGNGGRPPAGGAGDYRLLAEFNGVVLVGHPTQYGVQFVTWERAREGTGLNDGNYYGPCSGAGSYAAAKQGFAVRSGLVDRNALFAPEQLAEVYRSIHETLESAYPMTDERRKCLESTAEQIERCVPDLDARVRLSNQKEAELPPC